MPGSCRRISGDRGLFDCTRDPFNPILPISSSHHASILYPAFLNISAVRIDSLLPQKRGLTAEQVFKSFDFYLNAAYWELSLSQKASWNKATCGSLSIAINWVSRMKRSSNFFAVGKLQFVDGEILISKHVDAEIHFSPSSHSKASFTRKRASVSPRFFFCHVIPVMKIF